MTKKPVTKEYRPVLSTETRDVLFSLAKTLGFIVAQPGTYLGEPSVSDFIDALAAAYERDPGGVRTAMKVIGVFNKPETQEASES